MTDDCRQALRMKAYYYGFNPTGVIEVDRILSAVACAGKASHHTDCWTHKCSPYDGVEGETPIDWIQNAANKAAEAFQAGRASVTSPEVTDEMVKNAAEVLGALLGGDWKKNRGHFEYVSRQALQAALKGRG